MEGNASLSQCICALFLQLVLRGMAPKWSLSLADIRQCVFAQHGNTLFIFGNLKAESGGPVGRGSRSSVLRPPFPPSRLYWWSSWGQSGILNFDRKEYALGDRQWQQQCGWSRAPTTRQQSVGGQRAAPSACSPGRPPGLCTLQTVPVRQRGLGHDCTQVPSPFRRPANSVSYLRVF